MKTTPEQAEELAKHYMTAYVNACKCDTVEDAGNVLMKLASVVGLAMVATIGQDEAVARMEGTAQHIAKAKYSGTWRVERAN